jgi:hypothetical protein
MTRDELTVNFESHERITLLEEWRWLIGANSLPLLLTASGNAFVENCDDGSIHFLDASASRIIPIAESIGEFQRLVLDPDFVSNYFETPLVEVVRERGLMLASRQIYSSITPLFLGGRRDAENIEIADVEVHFSIQGQIARQVHALPDGASLDQVVLAAPKANSWKRSWLGRRLLAKIGSPRSRG